MFTRVRYQYRKLREFYDIFGQPGLLIAFRSKFASKGTEFEVRQRDLERPLRLRFKTSDALVYKQIFVHGDYDVDVPDAPRMIIDAGAYIGLSAVYFATRFPSATVVAIEPDRSNFELLEKNVAGYRNVTAVHAAVWSRSTRLELFDPGYGSWGYQTRSARGHAAPERREDVQAVTIDEIMSEHGCDFVDILKLDIEGAEKEVFEDAAKWIGKVGLMIVELHERLKPGCNRSFYNATNDVFDREWLHGENVYLARETHYCAPKRGGQ